MNSKRCPKCGASFGATPKYQSFLTSEWLLWTCGTCEYSWREPTKDAPVTFTASAEVPPSSGGGT